MPQPQEVEDLGEPLRRAYERVWLRTLAQQQQLVDDPRNATKLRRLREMQEAIEDDLAELDQLSHRWIGRALPRAYALGAEAGASQSASEFVWTQIHQQAAQSIANGLWKDLLKATNGVRDTTKALVRDVSRDESLGAIIGGDTAQNAGRAMARKLEESGIHAIKYADGSRHGLKEYGEMAQRTQTAIAYNTGTLTQAEAAGVVYWEVLDGPACGWTYHDDTTLALGLIVTKDEALAWPISHPNCRRTFGARPDITTPREAQRAEGSVTEGQTKAQMAADRALPGEKGARHAAEQKARGLLRRDAKLGKRTSTAQEKQLAKSGQQPVEPVSSAPAKPVVSPELETALAGNDPYDSFIGRGESIYNPAAPGVSSAAADGEWHEVGAMIDQSTGYQMNRGWIKTVDDREYVFEVAKDTKANEQMLAQFDAQIQATKQTTDALPAVAQSKLDRVNFMKGAAPDDSFWAAEFDKPDFKAAASAGNGVITSWGGAQARPGVILHEMGHLNDGVTGNPDFGLGEKWAKSVTADTKNSEKFVGTTKPFSNKGHELTPGSFSVTDYGAVNPAEDYAESFRLYWQDKHQGFTGFTPEGHKVTFADMFPERAHFFDDRYLQSSNYGVYEKAHPPPLPPVTPKQATQVAKAVSDPGVLPGLTEKQTALVKAMETWKEQGLDLTEPGEGVFKVIGKAGNIPEISGVKKVDVLAAQNHITAKTSVLANLTDIQKVYLQIAQDWKATGYDATQKSIQSVTGKLFKYPEAKGIKKADIEAVHNILAPGANITSATAGAVARSAEKSVRVTPGTKVWKPGIKESTRRKGTSFLNRAGKDSDKYPMPTGQPSHVVGTAQRAKHQLVGEITTALCDDRDTWDALIKSLNTPGVGWKGELALAKTGSGRKFVSTKVADFNQMSHAERYQVMYNEVNERIAKWAGTSGDSEGMAVMMQRAIKEEFQTTGDFLVRDSAESDLGRAVERQYQGHGDWFRRFARAMYQNTQDAFAAEGITEVSLYRGMNVEGVDWAKPHGGPRRILLQPANSWSTSKNVSSRFGRKIFEATVPADRVIGSARTGFGCFDEKEFVVLDSEGLTHLGTVHGGVVPLPLEFQQAL